MKFLEKDLESILYNNLSVADGCKKLIKNGLPIKKNPIRVWRQKYIGEYGRADLITLTKIGDEDSDFDFELSVYELKKDDVMVDAFMQGARYLKGVIHWMNYDTRLFTHKYKIKYSIYLIGTSFNDDGWLYLSMFFKELSERFNITLVSYNLELDGLMFYVNDISSVGWDDPGFDTDDEIPF